jgi:hypothetical protein
MRALITAIVLLAVAVPTAQAASWSRPRTVGTIPAAEEFAYFAGAAGPGGRVAFHAASERPRLEGNDPEWLLLLRVEGNGTVHPFTRTRMKGGSPGSFENAPVRRLAVGPNWRMLTMEFRPGRYGADVHAVRLTPEGRIAAAQRLGSTVRPKVVNGAFNSNARGDAIAEVGDEFTVSRGAGGFVRAPKALRGQGSLPRLAADGTLYDLRWVPERGTLDVGFSARGRRWDAAYQIFPSPGTDAPAVIDSYFASTQGGDAMLVNTFGGRYYNDQLLVRWSRKGAAFTAPVEIAALPDDFTDLSVDAVPGGAFTVSWIDPSGVRHLVRADKARGAFREVATWPAPDDRDDRQVRSLPDGRLLMARLADDRLTVAEMGPDGAAIGPEKAVVGDGPGGARIANYVLHRLSGNRAALLWVDVQKNGQRRVGVSIYR